jgi:hypothetical protein
MDLHELRKRVSGEIDNYIYEYPPGMVGNPWPAAKVEAQLQAFRSALVDPYWVDAVSTADPWRRSDGGKKTTRCAVVADDGSGYVVAFDPSTDEFFLATKTDNAVKSFGVSGDAVGCWMAR